MLNVCNCSVLEFCFRNDQFDNMVAMSGLDNFVGNKIGHAQHARRVKTRDGFHQP